MGKYTEIQQEFLYLLKALYDNDYIDDEELKDIRMTLNTDEQKNIFIKYADKFTDKLNHTLLLMAAAKIRGCMDDEEHFEDEILMIAEQFNKAIESSNSPDEFLKKNIDVEYKQGCLFDTDCEELAEKYRVYIDTLRLVSANSEISFCMNQKRTCYNGIYPFKIFPQKDLQEIKFAPITIFYGSNGSGKSTLLNVIAEKTGVYRHSEFSGGAFFKDYVDRCILRSSAIPDGSQILTSDDIFDYLLNIRDLNNGIDVRREKLFEDYYKRRDPELDTRLKSMSDYDDWKETHEARSTSTSKYVKNRLSRNVDMNSNGESAMRFFVEHIEDNAIYLLDEPENSLSIKLQIELAKFIHDSAKHYGCQFVIATHSPIMLSMEDALIYDLDSEHVGTKKWTELENVKMYFDFFMDHSQEFKK